MTEAEPSGDEAPGETSRESSGLRVHITCFVLALFGGVWALSSESSDPGQALGLFLVIGTLFAWGWYSGPWRTFARAGKPGALSLVPLYNGFILLEAAEKPGWWTLLWLVPVAQLFVGVRVLQALSKRFGRSATASVVLFLLGAAPFYYFAIPFLYLGFVEQVGHAGQIGGLGIKAFIAAVHVSILFGCLPLGLGRVRRADAG
jgi:hypothetical protein